MSQGAPEPISPEFVTNAIALFDSRIADGIAKTFDECFGHATAGTDIRRVQRLPKVIELTRDPTYWINIYVRGGNFSENAKGFVEDHARCNPSKHSREQVILNIAQYAAWWEMATAISRAIDEFSGAAIRESAKLIPPLDPTPLTAYLRTRGKENYDAALAFAKDLAIRVSALNKSEAPGEIPVATNDVVSPTIKRTTPSEHHEEILQALLELKAVDVKSRKTTTEIAKKAIGIHAEPAILKEPISELRKLGLIETKLGRGGGAWLTPNGLVRAKRISNS